MKLTFGQLGNPEQVSVLLGVFRYKLEQCTESINIISLFTIRLQFTALLFTASLPHVAEH